MAVHEPVFIATALAQLQHILVACGAVGVVRRCVPLCAVVYRCALLHTVVRRCAPLCIVVRRCARPGHLWCTRGAAGQRIYCALLAGGGGRTGQS